MPELLPVLFVVRLDLGVGNIHERIGHRVVFLAHPFSGEAPVGCIRAVGHLQRIDIGAAAHQSQVFGHLALVAGLGDQVAPRLLRPGIGFGTREEFGDGRHVVLTRTGIGEDLVKGLRGMLAADDGEPLGFGDGDSHFLETGLHHMPRYERLPGCARQHIGLPVVRFGGAALLADGVVGIQILRIADLIAVHHADLGIVPRKAQVGFQGEDECQQRESDDDRQNDTEFGP